MPEPIRPSTNAPPSRPSAAAPAPAVTAASVAQDKLQLSAVPRILVGKLDVTLTDVDGFADGSATDVSGTLSGTVRIEPAYLLQRLKDAVKSDGSKTITSIAFDPKAGAYLVKGRAKLWGFPGPSFTIALKPGPDGRLELTGHSWADGLARLLGRPDATASLRNQLAGLKDKIGVSEQGGKFYLDVLKGMQIPVGALGGQIQVTDLSGPRQVSIDGAGGLSFTLKDAKFAGGTHLGTPTTPDGKPDSAKLHVDFALHEGNQVEAHVEGAVEGNFDQAELERFVGAKKEVLGPLGKSAHVQLTHVVVDGTYSDKTNWRSTASADVQVEAESGFTLAAPLTAVVDGSDGSLTADAASATVSHPLTGDVKVGGVHLKKDKSGLSLNIPPGGETPFDPRPATDGNRLGLVLGGEAWEKTLLDVIGRAQTSIKGETFDFSEGPRTQGVLTALAERAMAGVPVQVLTDGHNDWAVRSAATLRGDGKEPWALALRKSLQDGTGKYAALTPEQRETALKNLAANLDIRSVPGGALRTDHRKIWIADGVLGMAGGLNLDDPMLSGIHDVMVPTIGPAVDDLASYWSRTWQEVGGTPITTKGDASRYADLVSASGSQVQVLVTDDRRAEIGHEMLAAINGAKHRIRLEHQYFTDDAVIQALAEALKRGVNVEVTVPEIGFAPFNTGNRARIMDLLEVARQPGAGKLDIGFWQQNGDYNHHNHLKALSVDGKELLVGSGNIDQRGLEGSLQGDGNRILFNRELDYKVTDPAYVAKFDAAVFDHDHRPGDVKPLLTKVAEDWAYPALAEGNASWAKFHDQGPQAATAWLLDDVKRSSAATLAGIQDRLGEGRITSFRQRASQQALLDAQAKALTAVAAKLDAGRAARAAAIGKPDARAQIAASVAKQKAELAGALPEGKVRTIALQEIDRLAKAVDDRLAAGEVNPNWFIEELEAGLAMSSIRAATLPARDSLAGLMGKVPLSTWDPELKHTLTPDPTDSARHETLSFLF